MRAVLFLVVCFFYCNLCSYSQWNASRENFLKQDSLIMNEGFEKILLHFDRHYYMPDDTLRVSGYVMNAFYGKLADSSKIIYLDIINAAGKTVKRISTYNLSGRFTCKLFLKGDQFSSGQYFVGAYTKHLLNYARPALHLYTFLVSSAELYHNWKLDICNYAAAGNSILLTGKLSAPKALMLQQLVTVRIYTGKKDTVHITPEVDGYFTAALPYEKNTPSVTIDIRHQGKYEPPILVSTAGIKPLKLDFYPEGGNLLNDIPQVIGVTANGITEKGIAVKGTVVDESNNSVTEFYTDRNGTGIIRLTPQKGKRYTAVINGQLSFELPLVKESAVRLRIRNDKSTDSIEMTVDATADLQNKRFFLRASSQGVSVVMGVVTLQQGHYSMKIARTVLPAGICHFVLYNENNRLVSERNIFIEPVSSFAINVKRNDSISPDSLGLLVNTIAADGKPVWSNLSVAIVNANSLPADMDAAKIASCYYLLSELDNNTGNAIAWGKSGSMGDIDNLLLTRQYVEPRYVHKPARYLHEQQYMVYGKVVNVINKPVDKAMVSLLGYEGRKFSFLQQSQSVKDGSFRFDDFPVFMNDSVKFLFTAVKKGNKLFNPSIEIDEMKGPEWKVKPLVTDTRFLDYKPVDVNTAGEQKHKRPSGIKRKEFLPEVTLKSKLKIAGSKNLNEDGGADMVIGTGTLQETPKETLLQVLYSTVPKFNKGKTGKFLYTYKISNSYIVFTIDGYNINKYYDPISESNTAFIEYCDSYLNYLKAEDIKGIEVMTSGKYTFAYESYYNISSSADISYAFIEITTFSGNGAFYKHSPNSLQYKPVTPVLYSDTYSATADDMAIAFLKSPGGLKTIYWNAGSVTTAQGTADFMCIKPDIEQDYIVVIQGVDQQGKLGYYYEYLDNITPSPQ
jgi:hypothetical protein